jgi:formylglycine-generating enzyme required for sulfatase activity
MTITILLFAVGPALANNVAISSMSLLTRDTSDGTQANHTRDIQFTVSWENSWCMTGAACAGAVTKPDANWDAVWVFAKYAVNTGGVWGDWTHCTLATSGHTEPAGSQIVSPADGKGVFIYKDAVGAGTSTFTNTAIRWRYGADGVADADLVRVRVFAIEMVYIPQGGFYAGDHATGIASFKQGTADTDPWAIGSEDAITTTNTASDGYYYVSNSQTGEAASGDVFEIPADFPKGYNDFYIMKYELSQGQWRDFLNTLTQAQQDTYTAATLTDEDDANTYVMVVEDQTAVAYRQTIKAGPNPADGEPYTFGCDLDDDDVLDEANDGEWIAMNDLSWGDLAGFADWVALRPFTELEFEKAARGPLWPVADEYVWASTSATNTTAVDGNVGLTSELPSSATMNVLYLAGFSGPIRTGAFARSTGGLTRALAGASYYGVMELSGNLWERTVTVGNAVGNAIGRAFTGIHGDGSLATAPANWPLASDADGSGFRGSSWNSGLVRIRVSDRYYAALVSAARSNTIGLRCARTAP